MTDIQNQDDIYIIVDDFYKKLFADKRISYIFTDIIPIHLHLEKHLQMLVTFWSQAILGTGGYSNNLTQIHLDLDVKEHLTAEHFKIWLEHFYTAIDGNFEGIKAEQMKTQALSIATVIQIKITQKTR
ncbi:group III truncated hemoglobin [Flavobacterium sp.]